MSLKLFKKGDIVLGAVLIVAALVLVFFSAFYRGTAEDSGILAAVIKQGDTVTHTVDLGNVEGQVRIAVAGRHNEVILIEKGRARFESADCPDKVCVRTGWLYKPGDMAVCIPNSTLLKIERVGNVKDGGDDIDIRAY